MAAILDIELLRTFHAVARIGKFSAAAEQLHKSPAAVSVHIQRLEAVAGGRLLNRDNQAVSLTALGKRLLLSTTELLSTHDRVLADLQGTHLAGRITLGVPDEYAVHVIRDILPVFAAAWPNVVLELKSAPSYALREHVARGKLQTAVIAQPKGQLSADTQFLVSTKPVWVGPARGVLASTDPLPLAIHAAQCPYREAMMTSLKANGRKTRVVLESPSNQAIKACVEAGLAISLIDRSGVTEAMQILDDLPEIPEHEIVFLRSPSSQTDEAVSLLAQALQKYFRV
ncbi:LysR family transcriptional regulator [Pseudomonas syringae pv. tagetis]|uniref:LysR family transcriptional regulator n=2 Tax=Pseudomonas syringae group genomosp. 7 TaxID=251699 RepID=A0A0Q0CIA9_9PSED|nr:LysR family transcriptional regulator [Pseudomonas syringae group genomosp. 7]KPY84865.1 Transcriptional regulator, LysR family [Pseudomonas syringae pv. tagetis]RMR02877.1 Transcriptional regulator, LysR family [Pseudomonas syringae pv. helianthi]RMV50928.1 Transcriptional regulator, LysR family [Pseudomonas syringae pv. helianthi]RMW09997.1 Transcriptional regulator, LysR family [Pseudomonas syringae pv. tagetis]RMW14145.1 Transcriptional regulator, LysR family [Pseudomonas syringae pv. t